MQLPSGIDENAHDLATIIDTKGRVAKAPGKSIWVKVSSF